MQATSAQREKDTENRERNDCEYEWCDGPESETLPCFACYNPDRDYDVRAFDER
jgi:hypothetical protein